MSWDLECLFYPWWCHNDNSLNLLNIYRLYDWLLLLMCPATVQHFVVISGYYSRHLFDSFCAILALDIRYVTMNRFKNLEFNVHLGTRLSLCKLCALKLCVDMLSALNFSHRFVLHMTCMPIEVMTCPFDLIHRHEVSDCLLQVLAKSMSSLYKNPICWGDN